MEHKPNAPAEHKPEHKPAETRKLASVYASAAAAEDPAVQQILGERQIHVMNGNMALADACDTRLNALGYA